mgnify:CR=1 FL=1
MSWGEASWHRNNFLRFFYQFYMYSKSIIIFYIKRKFDDDEIDGKDKKALNKMWEIIYIKKIKLEENFVATCSSSCSIMGSNLLLLLETRIKKLR